MICIYCKSFLCHDRPPRYMGEGFVVIQTADCKITYYQDEPGEFYLCFSLRFFLRN
mgnify:CR=1 FL=1